MHDGCIAGWHECDCACSSCGYTMVRTYTRFLDIDIECKKFHFGRAVTGLPSQDPRDKIAGRLYVQEACDPGEFGLNGAGWNKVLGVRCEAWADTVVGATSGKSIVQLSIRYLDVAG